MKATYQDFLAENPSCSGLRDNPDAQEVFALLSREENIIAMLELSALQQPALGACVGQLREWEEKKTGNTFALRADARDTETQRRVVDNRKKVVGRMVKTILAPFGYRVCSRKAISAAKYGENDFTSAACFRREEGAPATMRLVVTKKLVELDEEGTKC